MTAPVSNSGTLVDEPGRTFIVGVESVCPVPWLVWLVPDKRSCCLSMTGPFRRNEVWIDLQMTEEEVLAKVNAAVSAPSTSGGDKPKPTEDATASS